MCIQDASSKSGGWVCWLVWCAREISCLRCSKIQMKTQPNQMKIQSPPCGLARDLPVLPLDSHTQVLHGGATHHRAPFLRHRTLELKFYTRSTWETMHWGSQGTAWAVAKKPRPQSRFKHGSYLTSARLQQHRSSSCTRSHEEAYKNNAAMEHLSARHGVWTPSLQQWASHHQHNLLESQKHPRAQHL